MLLHHHSIKTIKIMYVLSRFQKTTSAGAIPVEMTVLVLGESTGTTAFVLMGSLGTTVSIVSIIY